MTKAKPKIIKAPTKEEKVTIETVVPMESVVIIDKTAGNKILEDLGPDYEMILLTAMIDTHKGMPTFAIIRDTFGNIDDFDAIIEWWVTKDYYNVLPPGKNIRDGYLTDLGRLYARNEFDIK